MASNYRKLYYILYIKQLNILFCFATISVVKTFKNLNMGVVMVEGGVKKLAKEDTEADAAGIGNWYSSSLLIQKNFIRESY